MKSSLLFLKLRASTLQNCSIEIQEPAATGTVLELSWGWMDWLSASPRPRICWLVYHCPNAGAVHQVSTAPTTYMAKQAWYSFLKSGGRSMTFISALVSWDLMWNTSKIWKVSVQSVGVLILLTIRKRMVDIWREGVVVGYSFLPHSSTGMIVAVFLLLLSRSYMSGHLHRTSQSLTSPWTMNTSLSNLFSDTLALSTLSRWKSKAFILSQKFPCHWS